MFASSPRRSFYPLAKGRPTSSALFWPWRLSSRRPKLASAGANPGCPPPSRWFFDPGAQIALTSGRVNAFSTFVDAQIVAGALSGVQFPVRPRVARGRRHRFFAARRAVALSQPIRLQVTEAAKVRLDPSQFHQMFADVVRRFAGNGAARRPVARVKRRPAAWGRRSHGARHVARSPRSAARRPGPPPWISTSTSSCRPPRRAIRR